MKYYGRWREVHNVGNKWFQDAITTTTDCPKLLAAWTAYILHWRRFPTQACTRVADLDVLSTLGSYNCPTIANNIIGPYRQVCKSDELPDLEALLVLNMLNPSFF